VGANCRRADLEALRQEKEKNGEPEVDETKSRMNHSPGNWSKTMSLRILIGLRLKT
jgi:hypothetical protein